MPFVARHYLDDPAGLSIWRYMDLEKLLSILCDQALFFASSRTLARDHWFEGQLTREEIRSFALTPEAAAELDEKYNRSTFERLFFNCWHLNEGELNAMWKIYINGNGGVAVRSTVERLKSSLQNSPQDISLGTISYSSDKLSDNFDHPIRRYMRKRGAFRHEQEARLVLYDENRTYVGKPGVLIPVEIGLLISEIVIAPKADIWFFELVKTLTIKLGYDIEVVLSEIRQP